ncbi:hypothetical protein THOM_1395 [Trachipleistophora hominis]|uniref:Uncharacterized protein n=1 Tax=Trachipleistophora hominis TaxID=72359 RepID=L7JW84_TRAHO|nr:hypothetical protein THOM_1395 [Trachipleistophora hominis]
MEKFANFNDPITGQNPFAPLPLKQPTLLRAVHLIYRVPLFILFLIGINTVPMLITIKCTRTAYKKMVCNSVSVFDTFVLRHLFPGHAQLYDVNAFTEYDGAAILFIEECASNGKMVTKFKSDVRCDGALFMKYSNECVYVMGSMLQFYWRFLMCDGRVSVKVCELRHSGEYARVIGVAKSVLGVNEKNKFLAKTGRAKQ